jgi:hypothetical protein
VGQLPGYGRRAADVGVDGAQGQHDGGRRGGSRAGPADGVAQQAGQGHVGGSPRTEDTDRGHREAQVQRGGDRHGDGHGARQLAGRVLEARGERRHSLLLGQILTIPSVVEAQSTFAIRTILSRGPLPLDHWRG